MNNLAWREGDGVGEVEGGKDREFKIKRKEEERRRKQEERMKEARKW